LAEAAKLRGVKTAMTDKIKVLALWGIIASSFVALILFHVNVWALLVVSVAFIAYVSRTTSAFLVRQHQFRSGDMAAWARAACMATVEVLACLGLVWLILWLARHLV
jgi:hypothetical protein